MRIAGARLRVWVVGGTVVIGHGGGTGQEGGLGNGTTRGYCGRSDHWGSTAWCELLAAFGVHTGVPGLLAA